MSLSTTSSSRSLSRNIRSTKRKNKTVITSNTNINNTQINVGNMDYDPLFLKIKDEFSEVYYQIDNLKEENKQQSREIMILRQKVSSMSKNMVKNPTDSSNSFATVIRRLLSQYQGSVIPIRSIYCLLKDMGLISFVSSKSQLKTMIFSDSGFRFFKKGQLECIITSDIHEVKANEEREKNIHDHLISIIVFLLECSKRNRKLSMSVLINFLKDIDQYKYKNKELFKQELKNSGQLDVVRSEGREVVIMINK